MTTQKTKEEMAKEYSERFRFGVEARLYGFLDGHASRDEELAAKDARIAELEKSVEITSYVSQKNQEQNESLRSQLDQARSEIEDWKRRRSTAIDIAEQRGKKCDSLRAQITALEAQLGSRNEVGSE